MARPSYRSTDNKPERGAPDSRGAERSFASVGPASNPARVGDTGAGAPAPLEVRADGVYKAFGGHAVLRGVDLTIRRGELVAIVGGSGTGKTVLLRHFLGRYPPDRGRVWVADHESDGAPLVDLATLDEAGMDRLRRHWAIVFQGNALFPGTVYENIALALREVKGMGEAEIGRRAAEVVTAVGLDVGSVLNLDRAELSGGMAKRVGIARALALEPALIFYDEPTSGLDPHLAQQIQDLINRVHVRGQDGVPRRTTILVTHDKDLLYRLQPRVVMLHEGRVGFDGSYESFRRSESAVIRPYFDLMPELHQRVRT
jgi:phospholipid/cholesterol/gamma-HCH transport system ATP-binding protein